MLSVADRFELRVERGDGDREAGGRRQAWLGRSWSVGRRRLAADLFIFGRGEGVRSTAFVFLGELLFVDGVTRRRQQMRDCMAACCCESVTYSKPQLAISDHDTALSLPVYRWQWH